MTASPASDVLGHWQMIRAELSGETAPELAVRPTELHLSATSYAVHFDGEPIDRGSIEIAESPEGRTMILRGETGPNAGRTIRCIFQLVGDRLRICYGLDGLTPTGFTTRAGQSRYLATYRRQT